MGRASVGSGERISGKLPTQRKHTLTRSNIIGFVALAVGCVLLFFSWQSSNAPVDQISDALTGRFTGNTMAYLLAGLIGVAAGGLLIFRDFVRA